MEKTHKTKREKRENKKTRKVDKIKSAGVARSNVKRVFLAATNAKHYYTQSEMQRRRALSTKWQRTPMTFARRAAVPIMRKKQNKQYKHVTSVTRVFCAPCNLYPQPPFLGV